jgi:hypothetical protein
MNTRKRMLAATSTLAVVAAVTGVTGLIFVAQIGAQLSETANVTTKRLVLLGEAKTALVTMRLSLRNCMYYAQMQMPAEFEASTREFDVSAEYARQQIIGIKSVVVTAIAAPVNVCQTLLVGLIGTARATSGGGAEPLLP